MSASAALWGMSPTHLLLCVLFILLDQVCAVPCTLAFCQPDQNLWCLLSICLIPNPVDVPKLSVAGCHSCGSLAGVAGSASPFFMSLLLWKGSQPDLRAGAFPLLGLLDLELLWHGFPCCILCCPQSQHLLEFKLGIGVSLPLPLCPHLSMQLLYSMRFLYSPDQDSQERKIPV